MTPAALGNDLWGDEITVSVRTPLSILKEQATLLETKTRGILRATVETSIDETRVNHRLKIFAPALKYSIEILTASHDIDFVYPVLVQSEDTVVDIYAPRKINLPLQASFDSEFTELLGTFLTSKSVKSVLHSLIARSNEATSPSK